MTTANVPFSPTEIDPTTVQRLREFGRRRRRLIALRGIGAGALTLLASLPTIAVLDRLIVMPDGLRWSLTVIGYLATLIIVWRVCLRWIVRLPSQRQLARLLEQVSPGLQEDLLSAVELGDRRGEGFDSPVFRALLQKSVADRMQAVDVSTALPAGQVGRWALGSLAAVAVILILCFVPSLPFGQLMLRAAVPLKDIERVSTVKVKIVEPSPGDRYVASGEPVVVLIETTDPELRTATLETRQPGKGREKLTMSSGGNGRFSGELTVGTDVTDYRIRAGDAVTLWHHLTPTQPPVVSGFTKSFHFPQYTGLPTVTRQDSDGNLSALQGTTVDLLIETDQPTSGEIHQLRGEKQVANVVRLTVDGDGKHLRVSLPIDESGTYEVRLLAAHTQLVNKYSPRYEIKAQRDLPPHAELYQPTNNRLVQPDELVALSGQAEDDLGLATVEQWVQINYSGEWIQLPLSKDVGRQTPIASKWDLLKLSCQPGDAIATKLVATDRKGNVGESALVQLTVNFKGMNPDRLAALEAKRAVLAAMDRLAAGTDADAKAMENAIDGIALASASDRTAALDKAQAVIDRFSEKARPTLAQLNESLQRLPRGVDVQETTAVARGVARLMHDNARSAKLRLQLSADETLGEKERSEQIRLARNELKDLNRTKGLAGDYALLVARETVAVALSDLYQLSREQSRLIRDDQPLPDDPMALRRMARVLDLVARQTGQAQELLDGLDSKRIDVKLVKPLQQVSSGLAAAQQNVAGVLASVLKDEREVKVADVRVGQWLSVGPFALPPDNPDQAFAPEQKIDLAKPADGYQWVAHSDWTDGGKPRAMDIPEQHVIYLYRTINSSQKQEVPLYFGVAGTATAWLNGEVVLQVRDQRYAGTDQVKRPVMLNEGQNNLLVRLSWTGLTTKSGVPLSPQFYFRAAGASSATGELERLQTPAQRLALSSQSIREALKAAIAGASPTNVDLIDTATKHRDSLIAWAGGASRNVGELDSQRSRAFRRANKSWELNTGAFRDLQVRSWPTTVSLLNEYTWLGEARPDADSRFLADTGLLARSLDQILRQISQPELKPEAMATVAESTAPLAKAYRTLEAIAAVRQIRDVTAELAALEQWSSRTPSAMTRHPLQWQFAAGRIDSAARGLDQAALPKEAVSALRAVSTLAASVSVEKEMDHRLTGNVTPEPQVAPLQVITAELERILKLLETPESDARAILTGKSPTLAQLMRNAAQESAALARDAAALAETKDAAAPATQPGPATAPADQAGGAQDDAVRTKLAELAEQQRAVSRLVQTANNALRQDANAQDTLQAKGRERARDADDAIALLRTQSAAVEAEVRSAVAVREASERTEHLKSGSSEAQNMAATLKDLAEHFDKLEKSADTASDTRKKLRAAEKELDIKDDLTRQYDKLERIAQLAELADQGNIDKLRAELEGDLAKDGVMQRELDEMTKNQAKEALARLEQAAAAEDRIRLSLRDVAVGRGELNEELRKTALSVQEQIKSLSTSDVANLRRQAEQDKVDHGQSLNEAQTAADLAAAQSPAQDVAMDVLAKNLSIQADALDRLSLALRKATDAAPAGVLLEGQNAASVARDAATKVEEAAVAEVTAREAAKIAADKAKAEPDAVELQGLAKVAEMDVERAVKNVAAAKARADAVAQQADVARQAAAARRPAADALAIKAAEVQKKAALLAKSTRSVARDLSRVGVDQSKAGSLEKVVAPAAAEQKPIGEVVHGAVENLRRAAENETRLTRAAMADALSKLADRVTVTADVSLPMTADQILHTKKGSDATTSVAAAQEELQKHVKDLEDLIFPNAAAMAERSRDPKDDDAEAVSASAKDRDVARQLARALDLITEPGKHAAENREAGTGEKPAAKESKESKEPGKTDGLKTPSDDGAKKAADAAKKESGSGSGESKAAGDATKTAADSAKTTPAAGSGENNEASSAAKTASDAAKAGEGSGSGESKEASGAAKTASDAAKAGAGSGSGESKEASGAAKTASDAAKAGAGSGSGESKEASGAAKTASDAAKAGAGSGSGESKEASGAAKTASDAAKAGAGSGSGESKEASGAAKTASDAAKAGAGAGSGESKEASGAAKTASDAAKAGAGSGSGSGKSDQASGAAKTASGAAKSGSGKGSGSGDASDSAADAAKGEGKGKGKGKGGSGGNSPDPATVSGLFKVAAATQTQIVVATRSGEAPGTDLPGEAIDYERPANAVARNKRDWGALQAKIAEKVSDDDPETVAEPYRKSVEAYFRVIARETAGEAVTPAADPTPRPKKGGK